MEENERGVLGLKRTNSFPELSIGGGGGGGGGCFRVKVKLLGEVNTN